MFETWVGRRDAARIFRLDIFRNPLIGSQAGPGKP
jgi:hypothetical protein